MTAPAAQPEPVLFDPSDPPDGVWPDGGGTERAYIEGIAAGVTDAVANVRTRWFALRSGDRVLPVTVNDGEMGDSYVCLPHSAYVLYAREELAIEDVGRWRALLRAGLVVVDALLRAAQVNRIVTVDNWLLSTNLHGDWDGSDLRQVRAALAGRFPDHLLAVRSVDPWSSPDLERALRDDGWLMVPSRQVWVTDDLTTCWEPTRDARNDRRLVARSPLVVEPVTTMSPELAERVADLYAQLYLDKYSALNPVFTARWVELTQACGLVSYEVARDPDGQVVAVAGSVVRGDVLTAPVVGYDRSRPRRDGLYRIAVYALSRTAQRRGVRLHGSAGAARFKRLRGGHPVVESMAVWTGSVSPWRRFLLRLFAALMWRLVVPLLRRRGL